MLRQVSQQEREWRGDASQKVIVWSCFQATWLPSEATMISLRDIERKKFGAKLALATLRSYGYGFEVCGKSRLHSGLGCPVARSQNRTRSRSLGSTWFSLFLNQSGRCASQE